MRPLNNKQVVVLELLRAEGEMSANDAADMIRGRTPCASCNGSGEGDDSRYGCRRCYGHGHVLFSYSDAYTALERLRRAGLVNRRHPLDEFGDELPRFRYFAIGSDKTDPLESVVAHMAALMGIED